MKNWENKGSVEGNLSWKKTTQKIINNCQMRIWKRGETLTQMTNFYFQPSGDNDWHAGGSQAVVKPDLAISGTFLSKLLHHSCFWDSQLKACMDNSWTFLLTNRTYDTDQCLLLNCIFHFFMLETTFSTGKASTFSLQQLVIWTNNSLKSLSS